MRQVTVGGREVRLTSTEYQLLDYLTANAGYYNSLIDLLLKREDDGNSDRVCTFVKQLLRKLEDDPACPAYNLNERGVGFSMRKP